MANKLSQLVALALSLIIITSAVITPALTALADSGTDASAKIAPQLARYLSSREPVEVVILLRELPDDVLVAERLSGGRKAVVGALRDWASMTQEGVVRLVVSLGGEVLNRFWITNAIVARVPGNALTRLASAPMVRKIIPNYVIELEEPEGVEEEQGGRVSSWGISKIRAEKVWAMGYTGAGVRVAVLDTGVDITHEALRGKMLTLDPDSPYYPGGWMEFDTAGNPIPSVPHDTRGHGTHVSGTVLGGDGKDIVIGVAPGATLMHGLVLPYGRGTFAQIIGGIEWAVDPYYLDIETGERVYTGKPAHIISMSFGARNYFGDEFLEPIKHALMANVIPVAAAGNSGPGTIDNPGNIWGVFAIGATDENDEPAYFSGGMVVNWPNPPTDWPFNNTYPARYVKPDFSAPGVHITSCIPGGGYESWSGTSMATPHVSGVIALILQATKWYETQPQDLPELVYKVLKLSSIDLGRPGQDTRYGWGRVDAYDAVLKALQFAKISGVSGQVIDTYSGEPVQWANVSVYTLDGELVAQVTTNQTGHFKVGLDPGTYRVVVERFGYVTYETTVEVRILNGTLAGAVLDEETGEPIEGAVVEVLEAGVEATTGPDGGFSISLTPGRYRVRVEASGYYPIQDVVEVEENKTTITYFRLYPSTVPVVLKVSVLNELTGEPVEGANVSVEEAGVWNLTDSSGTAYLTGFPPGTYRVSIVKDGMAVKEYQLLLEPGTNELSVNTTWWVAVLTYSPEDYGKDIKEALMSLGYPSYAITVVTPDEGVPEGVAAAIINYLGSDPGEGAWAKLVSSLAGNGTSVIFLDAWGDYYSFGGYLMAKYSTKMTSLGYPAPSARVQDYVAGAVLEVVDDAHPILYGVSVGEGGNVPIATSATDRVDFAAYPAFEDPTGRLEVVARLVAGTTDYGAGIAVWEGGVRFAFFGVGGSYQWNMYMERGADCQYSEEMRRILFNTVVWAAGGDPSAVATPSAEAGAAAKEPVFGPSYYTELSIGLSRKPFGWVEGLVIAGDTGEPIEGARVYLEGEHVEALTNSSGWFRLWLPAGEFVLRAYAPGYYVKEFSVEVSTGTTASVELTLSAAPRAAIMLDHANQLSKILEGRGWYAKSFDDWGEFLDAIVNGSYDVVIISGEYMGSYDYWPSEEEFEAVINATKEKGLGVVFLGNYFEYRYLRAYPYGIALLYHYEKDPRIIGSDFDRGIVYYVVEEEHPILKGYAKGEKIPIIEGGDYDFCWFEDWGGKVIASIGAENVGVKGAGIGLKVTDAGTRWVLLAGLAPEQWTNTDDWTEDAENIFYNAVVWAAVKPLEVRASSLNVSVGDTINITVSGAKGVNVTVAFDDTTIYEGPMPENGTLSLELKIPHTPMGEHRITAYSEGKYFGELTVNVVPSLNASVKAAAGARWVTASITGAPASSVLYLAINDNIVTTVLTSPTGDASINATVPDYIPGGTSYLKLRSVEGAVIATATITLPPSFTHETLSVLTNASSKALTELASLRESVTNLSNSLITSTSSIIAKVVEVGESLTDAINQLGDEVLTQIGEGFSNLTQSASSISSELRKVGQGLDTANNRLEEVLNGIKALSEGQSDISKNLAAVYAAIALSLLTLVVGAVVLRRCR